jgi:hypothetical protein
MRRPDTKEIILDTAERLFAERSYSAVSLREITAEAGDNLGLFRNLDDAGGQNGVGCAHNRNTPLIRLQACPNTFSP